MMELNSEDSRLLILSLVLGVIFFLVVCGGIIFVFKRLERVDAKKLKEEESSSNEPPLK